MKKLFTLFILAFLPLVASAEIVEIDGINYNLNSEKKTAIVGGIVDKYKEVVVIPPTVTYQDVEYTVTTIFCYAFESSSITSVTIPNSINYILEGAFKNCKNLSSLTLGNGLKEIDRDAFLGSNIGEVHISDLKAWCEIYFWHDDRLGYCNPLSCASCLYINGEEITDLVIPDGVTAINEHAFYGCRFLNSVTIPNSVTSIGDNAFMSCYKLNSVTIGNSITSIGNEAFRNCSSLKEVYCLAENVPNTGAITFYGSQELIAYVPAGSVDAYRGTSPWSSFSNIFPIDGKVKLSKTKATIEKGKTLTLKATVKPTNLPDKSVTWKSSDTKVATVTSAGKVKGVKVGTATITCTSNTTGAKATCKVTVGYVKLDKTEVTVLKGKTVTLTPAVYPSSLKDKTVTWESSDTKVATVTTAGKVKGVKAGTTTITCTSNATGLKATCTVNVVKGFVTLNKTEAYVEKGKTMTLKATVTPETLTDKSVTWTSSDKSIATVSSKGKVKGVKYGTATITCTSVATGVSATCQVTVGKVVVGVSEITIKKSRAVMLYATVYPTTLTDKSMTWKSSDTKVATVTSSGKVKGIAAGTATITCTSITTGLKGTCTVTVLSISEARSFGGDDDGTTGIEENFVAVEPFDVYDLSGRKVLNQVTSLDGLPKGIYIVNGKKVLKKD